MSDCLLPQIPDLPIDRGGVLYADPATDGFTIKGQDRALPANRFPGTGRLPHLPQLRRQVCSGTKGRLRRHGRRSGQQAVQPHPTSAQTRLLQATGLVQVDDHGQGGTGLRRVEAASVQQFRRHQRHRTVGQIDTDTSVDDLFKQRPTLPQPEPGQGDVQAQSPPMPTAADRPGPQADGRIAAVGNADIRMPPSGPATPQGSPRRQGPDLASRGSRKLLRNLFAQQHEVLICIPMPDPHEQILHRRAAMQVSPMNDGQHLPRFIFG